MKYDNDTIDYSDLKNRVETLILRETFLADPTLKLGAGPPVVLLTGFGSFVKNENGLPLPNITQALITFMIANRPGVLKEIDLHLAVSATDWLAPVRFHQIAAEIGPDIIINLGQGGSEPNGTRIETGALNAIGAKRDEYDEEGNRLTSWKFNADQIDSEAEREIELSWARHVKNLDPDITALSARPENTYICNATAWILASSIAGRRQRLFDSAFVLEPLPSNTLHGFLHLAQADYLENKRIELDLKLIQRLISALAN